MRILTVSFCIAALIPSLTFAKSVRAESSIPLQLIREGDAVLQARQSRDFAWGQYGECLQNFSGTWIQTDESICAPYVYARLADGGCYAINGYGIKRRQVFDSYCAENYLGLDSTGRCLDHLSRPEVVVQIYTNQERCAEISAK